MGDAAALLGATGSACFAMDQYLLPMRELVKGHDCPGLSMPRDRFEHRPLVRARREARHL